jgi:hypothetical protein
VSTFQHKRRHVLGESSLQPCCIENIKFHFNYSSLKMMGYISEKYNGAGRMIAFK